MQALLDEARKAVAVGLVLLAFGCSYVDVKPGGISLLDEKRDLNGGDTILLGIACLLADPKQALKDAVSLFKSDRS